ncbi:MAG: threonine synthase [Candidatus Marinimicrobia bacterium]|nr:threonine synthase [Candidatus Neomarinimicrobiota bacterium]
MTPQVYGSTRGDCPPLTFQDTVLAGLAPDGGLLIPAAWPDFSAQLKAWSQLSYEELAVAVCAPFVDFPPDALRASFAAAYRSFRQPEIAPVVTVGPVRIVELFHGPTLAFKDVALQWLGRLFADVLERRDGRLNILAATSGDTGSAAIAGVRGLERVRIFVMHPHGRTSPLQALQMTTVLDDNVFNLAVEGTFDDCQGIMKRIFRDTVFKERHALGAVNSVNWARVLAQIVYYFYAGLQVLRETGARRLRFAVPTGNFGDILAGYYAARLGLPIERLILATNENDILARFFRTGDYSLDTVVPTLSPSMDIQVASNFERYLHHRLGDDSALTRQVMTDFEQHGRLTLPPAARAADPLFLAERGDTPATLATIRRYYEEYGYLLDPHTAVGVAAAERHLDPAIPTICLATAHPAKFPDAIRQALGQDCAHHPLLDGLFDAPSRCEIMPADEARIRAFVTAHAH